MTRLGRAHRRIRELRGYRERGARDEAGVFLAEGLHLAQEALQTGSAIELALIGDGLREHPDGPALEDKLRRAQVELHECADSVMASLQQARSPQPVLLLLRQPGQRPEDVLGRNRGTPLVLAADGIQDPGNLGAMIRTAEAAGATGFVTLGAGADLFHPRTVRATAGSIFRLPAARMEPAEFRRRCVALKLRGVVSDPAGGREPAACDLAGGCALVFGGEGAGLDGGWSAWAAERVRIPMAPQVESLSVGAAAAVLLYEAHRQRSG